MEQITQLVGAVLILVSFIAAQRGTLTTHSAIYLVLNLVGSIALAVSAALDTQWGFLLLETVWAIVSLWGLLNRRRSQPSSAG